MESLATNIGSSIPSSASELPTTKPINYKVGYTLVKKGAKGAVVTALQNLLNKVGANLVVDGDFGAKTYAAVLNFQKTHSVDVNGRIEKLEADGVVGDKTWNALYQTSGKDQTSTSTTSSSEPSKERKYTGRVTADKLNVRTGPGTGYGLLPSYPMLARDNLVDVCDEVAGTDGGKWYYIRIAAKYFGYVSSSYLVKA